LAGIVHKAAKRYAQAIFDCARESGRLERASADLAALEALVRESAELSGFLCDYLIPRAQRRRVLTALFADRLDDLTWRCVLFLEEKRRLPLLLDVCVGLRELQERAAGIVKGVLTTALPADAAQVAAITDRLRKARQEVRLSLAVDPALLGGFRLQVNDWRYDLSLAGALRAFRERAIAG
jgi:F-type H+-transporting ATPase subunit delta